MAEPNVVTGVRAGAGTSAGAGFIIPEGAVVLVAVNEAVRAVGEAGHGRIAEVTSSQGRLHIHVRLDMHRKT